MSISNRRKSGLRPPPVDAYGDLARRIAEAWSAALRDERAADEAARNAVSPLALNDERDEGAARAAFTASLRHRRDQRWVPFARLTDTQIAFLVDDYAVPLWRTMREQADHVASIPAAPRVPAILSLDEMGLDDFGVEPSARDTVRPARMRRAA